MTLQILTMDEIKIGKISKQWTGLLREAFTDSDNFGIQFPFDLDVRMKAVMIGACFLIVSSFSTDLTLHPCSQDFPIIHYVFCGFSVQDFMFFETNN